MTAKAAGSLREVRVPDIGSDEKVDVIEILVAPGEEVAVEDGLVTLESDKATMDIPSPAAGIVRKIKVKVGDKVGQGDLVLELKTADSADAEPPEAGSSDAEPKRPAPQPAKPTAEATEPSAPAPADPVPVAAEPARAPAGPSPRAKLATRSASAGDRAEVLVLGAGPGGYTAAYRAADLGKKVVLVERYPDLGGVCLNVGCIPSKALLHVARVVDEAADLADHGVSFGAPSFDLDKLRGFKEKTVRRLTGGLAALARQRKVEVVTGEARLTGPNEVVVEGDGEERRIGFETAILAAGSRVVEIPGIPYDDPRVMSSTGALELTDIPKRLLVVGGGIIGLEMANVYGALGSEITIVELLDGLIPGCDRDLVKPLERRLKRRYKATIHLATRVERIEARKNGLKAFLEGEKAPESAVFDRALVAVGRRPNGDLLGLEAAGIEASERGFVQVDNRQRTSVPHIFAIGDLVGEPMLAHKAMHEGKVAAEVAAGLKSAFDARVIPSVAYTDPEIAWVGLTETEAEATGVAYEKGTFPWSASGRSLGMGRSDGLTKILFDPETKRVLGAGVVGPSAGDLIAELTLAIEMDCEAADIGLTIHPHPTLSETVALAAEAFEGTITDLYLPRK